MPSVVQSLPSGPTLHTGEMNSRARLTAIVSLAPRSCER